MKKRVMISGFGRVGRLSFAQLFKAEDFDIITICDQTEPKWIVSLLKYDAGQGKYPLYKKFDYTDNTIWVDGKGINIYPTLDTQKILREIKEEKIDVVIDCSKFYISKKTLQKYIDAGAKNAIASDKFGSLLHLEHKKEIKELTVVTAFRETKKGEVK